MTQRPILILAGVLLMPAPAPAQPAPAPASEVQSGGGLHSAVFRTPQGNVTVHVSADAAAGDTLSGVVLAEPAGATPQEQESNLGMLSGFVVDLQKQESKVANKRYRWTIPAAAAGAAVLLLRDGGGREVGRLPVPIDPMPPRQPRTPGTFDLPREAQPGRPAVVLGTLDGSLEGKVVSVDERPADLLATSPRQVVFRMPAGTAGPVDVRVQANGAEVRGTVRVLGVRLTATNTQLLRGQTATLTVTALGLRGLKAPVTLTLINNSADVVSVQGGTYQTFTVEPEDAGADGTYSMTRRLTGVRPGGFLISAQVSSPPMAQFDVNAAIDRGITGWQAATGISIAPDAQDLIRRSIQDSQRRLDEFLLRQQAQQGEVRELFDALLWHYCFDLRDEWLRAGGGRGAVARAPIRGALLLSMRQASLQPGPPQITAATVRRWSFSDFVSRVVSKFSTQPVGYLYVTSQPESAPITIDGQRKNEVTNRQFVASVGDHQVVVARAGGACKEMVKVAAFQTGTVACGK